MNWAQIQARMDLGDAGERAVADLIRSRGHAVQLDGGNSQHDLLVEGVATVEVKTALPSAGANGNKQRWQFKLFEDDGSHAPIREDVLVLRCQNGAEPVHHFIIPGCLLPERLKKLDITSYPTAYGGRYSAFLNAWELLDAVVALRVQQAGCRQMSLGG